MNRPDALDESGRRTTRRHLLLATGFVAAVIAATVLLPLEEWLALAATWIDAHPLSGRLLFVLGFVLLSVLMVPGSILMMCGGFVFGLLPALPLVSIGIGLGAGASGLVTRTLLRKSLAARFAHDRRFLAIDAAVAGKGFLIVTLSRLSLLMPYNLLNVIYGLSRIPLWKLTAGTWLGMTPSVVLYTYLGSVASDMEAIFAGETEGWVGELVVVSGLIMVGVVTWVIHRTATRALKRELGEPPA